MVDDVEICITGLKGELRRTLAGAAAPNGPVAQFCVNVAEAVGFEPTVGFHPRSVSNRVLSASQPRFRWRIFNGAVQPGQGGKMACLDESGGRKGAG